MPMAIMTSVERHPVAHTNGITGRGRGVRDAREIGALTSTAVRGTARGCAGVRRSDDDGTAIVHSGVTNERGTTSVALSSVAARMPWRKAAEREAKMPASAKPAMNTALL